MDQLKTLNRWVLVAALAAVSLFNHYMAITAAIMVGVLFMGLDERRNFRLLALLGLIAIIAVSAPSLPLRIFFAVSSCVICLFMIRQGVTDNLTVAIFIALAGGIILSAALLLAFGSEPWVHLEQQVRELTGQIQQAMTTDKAAADPEVQESLARSERLLLYLLPGEILLETLGAIFIGILVFRQTGRYSSEFELGQGSFNEYRFNDNLVWLLIVAMTAFLLGPEASLIRKVGANGLYFMSIMYVIRGLAVIFGLISRQGNSPVLKALVLITCFPPLCIMHLMFGVLDTWIDFRRRADEASK